MCQPLRQRHSHTYTPESSETCWVPFSFFFSPSQLKGKGGLLFCSPPNTFFISLICAPPSFAQSPQGSGNVSPQRTLRSGVQLVGVWARREIERGRKRRTERVSSGLRQASARAASRRCQKHLNLKQCVCVCVYHIPNQRLQGRFMPLPFSRPPLHQLIYTHYRIWQSTQPLEEHTTLPVCEREGMRLYTLATFPLGPCPPVSSVSLSVFISLSLIANKVNEEELEADGCTVHYSTAQYNVG